MQSAGNQVKSSITKTHVTDDTDWLQQVANLSACLTEMAIICKALTSDCSQSEADGSFLERGKLCSCVADREFNLSTSQQLLGHLNYLQSPKAGMLMLQFFRYAHKRMDSKGFQNPYFQV